MAKGMLIALMEPPAGLEEEFNDWYDTEHLPQRVACPGFESTARFVCVDGWPRYGALYDLASPAVIDGEPYKAIARTPWTVRIFPRVLGFTRVVAEQLVPGDAKGIASADISRLALARYRGVARERAGAIAKAYAALEGLAQARVFVNQGDEAELWVTAAFRRPVVTSALAAAIGAIDGANADLLNLYVPYRRG